MRSNGPSAGATQPKNQAATSAKKSSGTANPSAASASQIQSPAAKSWTLATPLKYIPPLRDALCVAGDLLGVVTGPNRTASLGYAMLGAATMVGAAVPALIGAAVIAYPLSGFGPMGILVGAGIGGFVAWGRGSTGTRAFFADRIPGFVGEGSFYGRHFAGR